MEKSGISDLFFPASHFQSNVSVGDDIIAVYDKGCDQTFCKTRAITFSP
jgi:hypothetical protein